LNTAGKTKKPKLIPADLACKNGAQTGGQSLPVFLRLPEENLPLFAVRSFSKILEFCKLLLGKGGSFPLVSLIFSFSTFFLSSFCFCSLFSFLPYCFLSVSLFCFSSLCF